MLARRLNTAEVHILMEKGGDWTGGQSNFELALNDTYSGGKHFGFSFAGGWRGCAVTPDTGWHHYAAVAVGGQADPILYIDGVPQTIAYRGGAAAMNLFASTRPMHIGAQIDPRTGWLYYSSTMIDEPAVFNRALSASEIQAIYRAGGAGKCVPPPPPACVPPPDNLVSWWRAEGSAADSAGGNNGVLLNGASFAPGTVGQAFSFNGNNQCVEIPRTQSLVASNYSIEAWVKPLAQVSDFIDQDLIFGQSYGHCQLLARTGSTGVRVAFAFGTSHFTFYEATGTSQIPIGQASHLAGTWDGTTLRLYINGVLNAQSTPGTSPVDSGCPFFIGGFYSPAADTCGYVGQFFNGLIDEVSYYRRALTAVEIQANYNAGSAGKCSPSVAPSIITQPASLAVLAGATATFTVTAAGTPALSYQWRLNGTNIAGATSTSLTLSNVQPAQAGNYALRVTNALGSILSSNALLTVILPCVSAPSNLVSWWRGESNALDQVGGNSGVLSNGVSFDAGVVGQAFRFNGSSNSYVEVADSPTLRFTNALTIECWAKRLSTSEVHVLLEKGGDWTGGQTDFEIVLNDTYGSSHFGFSSAGGWRGCSVTPDTAWHHYAAVAVSGQSNPILYIDGVPQTIAYSGGAATIKLSASTRPLHIGAQVDAQTGWLYYSSTMIDELSIFNRALSAAEIQAIYTAGTSGKCLSVAPSIITQPASQAVLAGAAVTFTAAAAGTPRLDYQWRFNGTNIAGATSASLTLSNAQPIQAGSYSVLVTNALGSITSAVATLTVLQPPVITRQPRSLVAIPGGAASFSVSAQGCTPFAYQWRKGGSPLVGQTKAALTVTNVQPQDFSAYTVGITNAGGSVLSDAAMLTLAASPVVRSLSFNSETFMLTVPTEVGLTYVIEYKDSLQDASWKVLTTLAGTGLPIPMTDNGLTNTTRYYRVRVR